MLYLNLILLTVLFIIVDIIWFHQIKKMFIKLGLKRKLKKHIKDINKKICLYEKEKDKIRKDLESYDVNKMMDLISKTNELNKIKKYLKTEYLVMFNRKIRG